LAVVENISLRARHLLEEYHFNVETLAKYLCISVESVYDLVQGKTKELFADPSDGIRIINKIMNLDTIMPEETDMRVQAYLDTLLSYHKLSKETVAVMAEIEIADIDKFLSDECEKMDIKIKYKIASVTMALRFFLKDNEPKQ
jgi:hypothetical protein